MCLSLRLYYGRKPVYSHSPYFTLIFSELYTFLNFEMKVLPRNPWLISGFLQETKALSRYSLEKMSYITKSAFVVSLILLSNQTNS